MLLATLIMAIIIGSVYSTWTSCLRGLKRARDLTESLQRERAILDILAESFRCAMFSQENADWYGWQTEDLGDADTVSFVTTSIPSIGKSTAPANVPQRLQLSLEPDNTGNLVLLARVRNFLAMDLDNVEKTIPLADWAKTFNMRYYDADNDQWLDTWDNTDSMPAAVEMSITMASSTPNQPDVTFSKTIWLPLTGASSFVGQTKPMQ